MGWEADGERVVGLVVGVWREGCEVEDGVWDVVGFRWFEYTGVVDGYVHMFC